MSKEMKTRNGYYIVKERYLPRVSTITGGYGGEGLMRWAAEQSAVRVVTSLRDLHATPEKIVENLKSNSCIEWAKSLAPLAIEEGGSYARSIGTTVHGMLEDRFNGKKVDESTNDLANKIYTTVDNFFNDTGLKVTDTERTVWYEGGVGRTKYAGTLDFTTTLTGTQITKLTPYLGKASEVPKKGYVIGDFKTGRYYGREHVLQLACYGRAVESIDEDALVEGAVIVHVDKTKPDTCTVYYFPKEHLVKCYQVIDAMYLVWLQQKAPQWYLKQEGLYEGFPGIKAKV